MAGRKRYIVECIWSGYTPSQRRPCHRHVTNHPKLYEDIHAVVFSDNTYMTVTTRECKPREKVNEIRGYDKLLDKIIGRGLTGTIHVSNL